MYLFQAKIESQEDLEKQMWRMGLEAFKQRLNALKSLEDTSNINPTLSVVMAASLGKCIEAFREWAATEQGRCDEAKKLLKYYMREGDLGAIVFLALKVATEHALYGKSTAAAICDEIGTIVHADFHAQDTHAKRRVVYDLKRGHKASTKTTARRVNKLIGISSLPTKERIALGMVLLHGINHHTGIFNVDTQSGVVTFSPEIEEHLEKRMDFLADLHHSYLPWIAPPKPWVENPSYTGMDLSVVRTTRRSNMPNYSIDKIPDVYAACDILNKVPYKVNTKVLDVIMQCRKLGLKLPELDQPKLWDMPPVVDKDKVTLAEWRSYNYAKYKTAHRNRQVIGMHRRIDKILELAYEYQKVDKFWFVWSADYRGRMYPIQKYMTPQGSDLERALLMWGDPVKVEANAEYWIKAVGATRYGLDKVSRVERNDWVQQNYGRIVDTAYNPFRNRDWWSQAKDPWQFLAWCIEYVHFLDTGEFNLPLYMDGTCNGLQHLSMLTDDMGLAEAVNVVGGNLQDFYAHLSNLVNVSVNHDLQMVPVACADAQYVAGNIDRSFSKKPVMSWAYGVSGWGMNNVIYDYLHEKRLCPDTYSRTRVTQYLAGVFQSVLKFELGRQCQWYTDVKKLAKEAAEVGRFTIQVGGYPLIVDYRKRRRRQVFTRIFGTYHINKYVDTTDDLDLVKNVNAFVPNLVHTLDSLHLRRVLIESNKHVDQFNIATIHDSIGVDANNYGRVLSMVCEQFKYLYRDLEISSDSGEHANRLVDYINKHRRKVELEQVNSYMFN